jgi:A/G-specific adenine glycosylase
MTPQQEVRLLAWYREVARELPWRSNREFYPVLVSELMLQQTTVAAVIPLYQRFMARFPDLASLARAEQDEVLQAWSGLGYYSRARRLHQAAQLLHRQGRLPTSYQELLQLPGLGPYTASAVASIALGLPHLALDTNAFRVLLRLYGWQTRVDRAEVGRVLRGRVQQGLADSDFGLTNQAIMELGATVCRIKQPACESCPLRDDCQAWQRGQQEEIPLATPRKPPRVTAGRAYLMGSPEALLLVRGTSLGLLPDLYGPPIDFGAENRADSPMTALLEWLRPELEAASAAGSLRYGISGRKLELEVVRLQRSGWENEVMAQARRCGVEACFWTADRQPAMSSLARRILKVGS